MERNWMELLGQSSQLPKILETNAYTGVYGLTLSEEEAQRLLENRRTSLREQNRVEFGDGILLKLIREFCDSNYVDQQNYADTLMRLQEIFYLYKNEMNDEITDDELIHLMREQYENLCFGDLDYLEGTCLANFAQAIRAGYRGYHATDGYGEYDRFDLQERWSYELYLQTLQELCWR